MKYRFWNTKLRKWVPQISVIDNDVEVDSYLGMLGIIAVFQNDIIQHDVPAYYTQEEYLNIKKHGGEPWFWVCRMRVQSAKELQALKNGKYLGNARENPELDKFVRDPKDGKDPYEFAYKN